MVSREPEVKVTNLGCVITQTAVPRFFISRQG
jgi:hypothetical protein